VDYSDTHPACENRVSPLIYVILLAYNEEKNIGGVIQEIARTLLSEDFKIVVVNDGSSDQTKARVEALSPACHTLVIDHETNRGVSEGFRTGLSHVAEKGQGEDIAVTMEGDGTNDCATLPGMVRKIREGFDIVCASRYRAGGGYSHFPGLRLVYSRGANFILSLFFPIEGVRDYTIFYRGYRVRAVQRGLLHYGRALVTSKSFAVNAEILIKLHRLGLRVAEVPVRYNYGNKQSRSQIRILKTILEYLKLCWKGAICRQF